MKATVIGGCGFIGSHLVDALDAAGVVTTIIDPGSPKFSNIAPRVAHLDPAALGRKGLAELVADSDIVYHLAWSSIHESSNLDPGRDVRDNVLPTLDLIRACLTGRPTRFVFTSSGGTVYGPGQQSPVHESAATRPRSSYGITKLAVEHYLDMFHRLEGLDYITLRPSTPYGPRQNPLARQGVISVFMHRIGQGLPIQLWGSDQIARDFFYVGDLVRALIRAGQIKNPAHRTINLGGGSPISLADLIARCEDLQGRKAIVNSLPKRDFDNPTVWLDIQRAKALLDWSPEIDFEEGTARTHKWLVQEFPRDNTL
jgi:UDP-glucose 4-epimerase